MTAATGGAVRHILLPPEIHSRFGAPPGVPGLASLTVQRLAHQAVDSDRLLGVKGTPATQDHSPRKQRDRAWTWRSCARKECLVFHVRGERGVTTGRRRKGRRAAAVVAAVVVPLLVLARCATDDAQTGPITVPTSTTAAASPETTTSVHDPVTAEIVDRYKQFWEIRFEANREPVNPDDPRLREYATGQQLEKVIGETRQRRDQGLAIRRPERSVYERRVKVVRVDGDTATLQDCVTNDGVVYRVATGAVIDDKVVTRNVAATMRLVDGTWKLGEARVVQAWEGVAGCALSQDF